jgi:hypothetical protein
MNILDDVLLPMLVGIVALIILWGFATFGKLIPCVSDKEMLAAQLIVLFSTAWFIGLVLTKVVFKIGRWIERR